MRVKRNSRAGPLESPELTTEIGAGGRIRRFAARASPRALVSFKLVRVAVARAVARARARRGEGVPSPRAREVRSIPTVRERRTRWAIRRPPGAAGARPRGGSGIGRGWRRSARSASGSAALVLALLSALVGAAEPAHDDAAHVGGDVYVYDLLPARGLAGGGAAVTLHGSGFNDAIACQFGPRVVPARAVSPEGDRMICVAPPFPRPSGGDSRRHHPHRRRRSLARCHRPARRAELRVRPSVVHTRRRDRARSAAAEARAHHPSAISTPRARARSNRHLTDARGAPRRLVRDGSMRGAGAATRGRDG